MAEATSQMFDCVLNMPLKKIFAPDSKFPIVGLLYLWKQTEFRNLRAHTESRQLISLSNQWTGFYKSLSSVHFHQNYLSAKYRRYTRVSPCR